MHSSTAFIFPGQGSQYVGMLADLIQRESVVADTLSEASNAIDLDLRALILTGAGKRAGHHLQHAAGLAGLQCRPVAAVATQGRRNTRFRCRP